MKTSIKAYQNQITEIVKEISLLGTMMFQDGDLAGKWLDSAYKKTRKLQRDVLALGSRVYRKKASKK